MATEVLSHRNYFKVAENNMEFIRGDIWDFEVTKWPLAVYNPGLELFKTRLKDGTLNMQNGTGKIEKEMFAQKLHQNAGRDIQAGSITFNFVDKEDQAIVYTVNDWLNQIADPDTGFGRHKKELLFEGTLFFYNTLLEKVRYYDCFTGILDTTTIPETPGAKGSDLSDVTMTIQFEMIHRKLL